MHQWQENILTTRWQKLRRKKAHQQPQWGRKCLKMRLCNTWMIPMWKCSLEGTINTSYLTESYIVLTLKMESVSKNTIFGLQMMVKSGLEKIFLKFLHAGNYFPLLHKSAQNHKFSNLPAWRDFKINFSRPLFTIIFRPKMVFWDTDSILRVKPMYESVK